MNIVNRNKPFITFVFVVCKEDMVLPAARIAELLVTKGHVITIFSSKAVDCDFENNSLKDIEAQIERADLTAVFCTDNDKAADQIRGMVRKHDRAYVLKVIPEFFDRGWSHKPQGFDDIIYLYDLVSRNARADASKVYDVFCNLALY